MAVKRSLTFNQRVGKRVESFVCAAVLVSYFAVLVVAGVLQFQWSHRTNNKTSNRLSRFSAFSAAPDIIERDGGNTQEIKRKQVEHLYTALDSIHLLYRIDEQCDLIKVFPTKRKVDPLTEPMFDLVVYDCSNLSDIPCDLVYLKKDSSGSGYIVICGSENNVKKTSGDKITTSSESVFAMSVGENKTIGENTHSVGASGKYEIEDEVVPMLVGRSGHTGLQPIDWSDFKGSFSV